jgi:hypothetical protein
VRSEDRQALERMVRGRVARGWAARGQAGGRDDGGDLGVGRRRSSGAGPSGAGNQADDVGPGIAGTRADGVGLSGARSGGSTRWRHQATMVKWLATVTTTRFEVELGMWNCWAHGEGIKAPIQNRYHHICSSVNQ